MPEFEPLEENNERVRYLTDDEEDQLLDALHESVRPLIKVAIHTGMRRGELLNLTWDNVDLNVGVIFVRTSKSERVDGSRLARQFIKRWAS